MKLSLIDLSIVPHSGSRHEAIQNTLDMARQAENWGYERIWLAEHHGTGNLAGRAPEVLIPYIAAHTKSIRVGSGSVLLNHYSPYKVAENFATLEDIFPGRIDMGIGRATTGPTADFALQRNRTFRQTSDDSAQQLLELIAWLEHGFEPSHPFSELKVYRNETIPDFWLLGSSGWSATAAAELGLRYTFAGFINPDQAYAITDVYRTHFKPAKGTTGIQQPQLILALSVYCSDTEEEALRLSAPVRVMMKRLMSGDVTSRIVDEDEAVRIMCMPEPTRLDDPKIPPRILAGTPAQLKDWLTRIAGAFQTDELMIQCITANHQARLKSHRLLAEAFGLIR